MSDFSIHRNGDWLQVSMHVQMLDQEALKALIERLRVEYMAQKINFTPDVEVLGEEIKQTWWRLNRAQILQRIHEQENGSR